jgi:HEAT repeat protein
MRLDACGRYAEGITISSLFSGPSMSHGFKGFFGWLWRLGTSSPIQDSYGQDPQKRQRAAEQLGAVKEAGAAERLLDLLRDPSSLVRDAAKASLRQQGPADVAVLLGGLNDSDPEVGKTAAELLGVLGRPETIPPLLTALKYNARPVQIAARRALEAFGPAAIPALENARSETQPWVRQQIEEALAQIRSKT